MAPPNYSKLVLLNYGGNAGQIFKRRHTERKCVRLPAPSRVHPRSPHGTTTGHTKVRPKGRPSGCGQAPAEAGLRLSAATPCPSRVLQLQGSPNPSGSPAHSPARSVRANSSASGARTPPATNAGAKGQPRQQFCCYLFPLCCRAPAPGHKVPGSRKLYPSLTQRPPGAGDGEQQVPVLTARTGADAPTPHTCPERGPHLGPVFGLPLSLVPTPGLGSPAALPARIPAGTAQAA